MKADTIDILEFLGATKRVFNIPVYQRSYSWKQEQCKKLFDDLLNIKKQNKSTHFIGTVVYVDINTGPSFKEFIIIDGQQRLTTILLLLKALFDEANDEDFKEDLYNTYLINHGRMIKEKYRIKLKTVANDAKIFERLISKQDVEEIEKGSKILENYRYFRERISKSNISEEEIFNLIQKLSMVYIMLDSDKEDAQLIFESLNSTGLDLTPADLIRNYLLMGYSREKQEKLYEEYWKKLEKKISFSEMTNFIKDYLTIKNSSIPNKNKIYETFKEFYIANIKNKFSIEEFLLELIKYAKYYEWIENFNSNYETLNLVFQKLKKLNSSVINPFLFYTLNKFENKEIDINDVIKTCELIKSYIIRRAICNIQTNALNKIFASLAKEVENHKLSKDAFFETVLSIILNKTLSGIMPRDIQFKEALITRDMYSFKLNSYILKTLLLYNTKESIDDTNLTIEHIMPQKLSSKWKIELGAKFDEILQKNIHLLGNLTLSGYNSEISNREFSEKKEYYKNSNIYFNRELLNYNEWNEKSILDRGKKLAEVACKVWPIPKLSKEFLITTDITNKEFNIFENINVTNRKPCLLNIMGDKFTIKSWKEFFIKLCENIYSLDEEKFLKFTKHRDFKGKSRRIIANKSIEMRKPIKISSDIFVETNLSANDILNYSKLIMEKYNTEDIEVRFKIQ